MGLKGALKSKLRKVGERIVAGLGDTSSDTPSGGAAPKRQAYDAWLEQERARTSESVPKPDRGGS
jgi:hypothetical protein